MQRSQEPDVENLLLKKCIVHCEELEFLIRRGKIYSKEKLRVH